MSLFKYTSFERIDILLKEEIRYTQPGAFNDPFEMPAFVEKVVDSKILTAEIERQFEEGMKNAYSELSEAQWAIVSLESYESLARQRLPYAKAQAPMLLSLLLPKFREALRSFDRLVGVLSLTETPDNLLMWAHYGDQHKGIVIEFDEHHPTFNERKTINDEFRYLRKVNYSNERPVVDMHSLTFDSLLLTKSLAWSYENEWRILKSVSDAARKISQPPYDVFLFKMPSAAIKAIIFGVRVPDQVIAQVKSELLSDARYGQLRFRRALLEDKHFGLSLIDC